jgi:two-component system chemotaxis response regulator CheB
MFGRNPLPVIIISSLAQASSEIALEALRLGAVEILAKPAGPYSVGELRQSLATKIRAAAASSLAKSSRPGTVAEHTAASSTVRPFTPATFSPADVIAIGASTGGVSAIQEVLTNLPEQMPGIVITQHIPAGFSKPFAERLNQICALRVKQAEDGEPLTPGTAVIAPGDRHLVLQKARDGYAVHVKDGPQVCYQRPSVDVLFHSVARTAGSSAIGVLLTGMGADGADGLLAMKKAGAPTIAQDESTCVVFGMPREAIARGAATAVRPLPEIPTAIQALLNRQRN